jgi:hypothetical protein
MKGSLSSTSLGQTTTTIGSAAGCLHDKCTTGSPLLSSCDACTAKVISSDPYCGNSYWDRICVQKTESICGIACVRFISCYIMIAHLI